MDGFAICSMDIPFVCSEEITELIKKDVDSKPGICHIKKITPKDLAILAHRCQTAHQIGIFLGEVKINPNESLETTKNNIQKELEKIQRSTWKEILPNEFSFSVSVKKLVPQSFTSMDLAKEVGDIYSSIFESKKFTTYVDLKKPTCRFITICTETKITMGIDLIGFDLAKRPYKLFSASNSINGICAATLVKLMHTKKQDTILDPFSGSGTIPIEAALYANETSSFYYEEKFAGFRLPVTKDAFKELSTKLRQQKIKNKKEHIYGFDSFLKTMLGAQKNAKISGVHEIIKFSKVSVDWLDAKFEEGDVDYIITDPPKESKRNPNNNEVEKLLDELFYQGRFVLKKKGKAGILCVHRELVRKMAKKQGFKEEEDHFFHCGQQPFHFLIFSPPAKKIEE